MVRKDENEGRQTKRELDEALLKSRDVISCQRKDTLKAAFEISKIPTRDAVTG